MDHRLDVPIGVGRILPSWAVSLATVIFASGALILVIWNPRALGLAVGLGVLAFLSRALLTRVRAPARGAAKATSAVANAGLVVAGVAVAPLIAFAILWFCLLVLIGATWVLHLVGLA